MICEENDQANLHKVLTDVVDANLKNWAEKTRNFDLLGKLVAVASDAHASDAFYHRLCYEHLRDSARAAERRESVGPAPSPFDPMICAQMVALIESSDTSIFKLSELRDMYRTLMKDQGCPLGDNRDPHSTRFKEHLLSLLPEWAEYSKVNAGRTNIYVSHKVSVADELAK